MAVRGREMAAASLGIAVAHYKLLAFVTSAVMTSARTSEDARLVTAGRLGYLERAGSPVGVHP